MGITLPASESNSLAVVSGFSDLRLAITTLAPAAASRWVIALPIPLPPPVTMATFPLRVLMRGLKRVQVYFARTEDAIRVANIFRHPIWATNHGPRSGAEPCTRPAA